MNELQKKALEEILELEREANRRLQAGDLEWIFENTTADEIIQMAPGKEAQDKAGYMAWFREFAEMEGVEFSFGPIGGGFVSESGDLAACHGWTKLSVAGQPDRVGKYVSVWKNFDGKWLAVYEANNFDDA